MTEKEEHLKVGNKDSNCELCGKSDWTGDEPLTSDVKNCEIYLHKNCYERALMIIDLFKDAYEDYPKEEA